MYVCMYVVDSSQLLKPVNDILRAQAAKEKAAKERQSLTETKPVAKEILVGKDEKGKRFVSTYVCLFVCMHVCMYSDEVRSISKLECNNY